MGELVDALLAPACIALIRADALVGVGEAWPDRARVVLCRFGVISGEGVTSRVRFLLDWDFC